jgi:hypothetical protein
MTLTVLEPTAESSIERVSPAARLSGLRGKRIWFLDNQGESWGKGPPVMNPLFRTWAERLEREHEVRVQFACTETFSAPFRHGKQRFEEVVASADAIINGLACCGSGTSAVIHDAVAYERRRVPTVSLVTDNVLPFASAASRKLGLPELKVLTVSHRVHAFAPLVPVEESQRVAHELYPAMVAALVQGTR